jgi:wyosine [tRNA(Phe)-imidazoG37] synthetase (radical SAM superfamily)
MAEGFKHIYGPVPSRRLGLSLGVDVTPLKLCTYDCVYCQLGRTTTVTIERGPYVPAEDILNELRQRLTQPLEADFITIGGSGEPTLNSQLGQIIRETKKMTGIPLSLLTNGALFYGEDVRADCLGADVVLPSLDAGDEQTFRKINRPHPDISVGTMIEGLCAFRRDFPGRIWLEVFIVEGLNTESEQIDKIKEAAERIRPDKIHLNTAVRPTAESGIRAVGFERLKAIAALLGPKAQVIADPTLNHLEKHNVSRAEDVLSMLKRRPCSLEDICAGLGIHPADAAKYIGIMTQRGLVQSSQKGKTTYFRAF